MPFCCSYCAGRFITKEGPVRIKDKPDLIFCGKDCCYLYLLNLYVNNLLPEEPHELI